MGYNAKLLWSCQRPNDFRLYRGVLQVLLLFKITIPIVPCPSFFPKLSLPMFLAHATGNVRNDYWIWIWSFVCMKFLNWQTKGVWMINLVGISMLYVCCDLNCWGYQSWGLAKFSKTQVTKFWKNHVINAHRCLHQPKFNTLHMLCWS